MREVSPARPANQVRLRAIALPPEHGGWGFLLEPLLLGLLLAPTYGGLMLALATVGAFLLRHPLKTAMTDRRRKRRYARTTIAERFVLIYSVLTASGLILATAVSSHLIWIPLFAAAPLVGLTVFYDLRGDSRHWLPELAGPVALGATTASITLAGGWTLGSALAGWAIITARAIPSVMYVRARLRLEKNQNPDLRPTLIAQVGSVAALLCLVLMEQAPVLALATIVILLLRAFYGLSRYRRSVPAKVIGFQEIAYGLLVVAMTVIGFTTSL